MFNEKKMQVQAWLFIGNWLIHEIDCYLLEWSQMEDRF